MLVGMRRNWKEAILQIMTAVHELKSRTAERKECIANSATPEPPIEMGRKAMVETPNDMTVDTKRLIPRPLRVRITHNARPSRSASTRVRARALTTTGIASCFIIDLADSENVLVALFTFSSRVLALVPPTKYCARRNSGLGKLGIPLSAGIRNIVVYNMSWKRTIAAIPVPIILAPRANA